METALIVATDAGEVISAEKSFEVIVDEWLNFLATKSAKRHKEAKARTLESYRYSIHVFKKWLDSQGVAIEQTTEDTITLWVNSMDATKWSDATKNAYLSAVKSFFKWAHVAYKYENAAAGFNSWQIDKEHKRGFLSIDEMKKLLETVPVVTKTKLDAAKNESQRERIFLQGLRDKAILSVLMCGGLRTIEISRLTVADLTTNGGVPMLNVWGKGHTESDKVTVKISRKVEKVIRDWMTAREAADVVSDDSPLFCSLGNNSFGDELSSLSVSRLCKDYLRAAGLKEKEFATDGKDKKKKNKPIVAHSLRASCATCAFQNGAKIEQVQQQLRHAHLATTEIYLHEAEKALNPVSDIISDGIF